MNGSIDYLAALRRNALIAIVVAVVVLVTTYVTSAAQKDVYEAAAQLVVIPASLTTDASDVIRSVDTLERRTIVATFARIASAPDVRSDAARLASLPASDLAAYTVRGSVVPNTNIIRIEASGPNPQRAAVLANAAADTTARSAQQLYRVYELKVLSKATPPAAAAYPDRKRSMLVGLILALFLGALAALLADRLRRGTKTPAAATASPEFNSTPVIQPVVAATLPDQLHVTSVDDVSPDAVTSDISELDERRATPRGAARPHPDRAGRKGRRR